MDAVETVTATPSAGADASPAAAAPSSPTPAAAPAATETTPSTTSTEAPAVTTPAEPEEFKVPEMEFGEESLAYMKRVRESREQWTKDQEAKKTSAAQPETKPAEPPKQEEKPPEEKKPDEPAPEDDLDKDPVSTLALDDLAPIPPRELHQKLTSDPELVAKLQAAGVEVSDLIKGQRLAAQYSKVLEQFPGGLDDVVYAKEQASTFGQLDDIFTSIKTAGMSGVDKLIGALTELDYVIGDDGKPVLDDRGNPLQQGNTGAFLAHLGDYTFDLRIDALEKVAAEALKANPDDEAAYNLQQAVEVIKARLSGSATDDHLTPQQKEEAARLKSEREALDRTKQADAAAKAQQFEDRITTESDKTFDSAVIDVLKKTDLRPELYNQIVTEVRDQVAERLALDTMFTSRRDWIMRANASPEVEKRRIAHNVNSMRAVANGKSGVLATVLTKYGAKLIQQNQERRSTIAAQVTASRSEPKTSTSTAAPRPPITVDQAVEKARATLRERTGTEPETRDVMKLARQIQAGQVA